MHTAIMLALFLILLALTAFFNLAEMALVAARTSKLEADGRASRAARVLELKQRPGLFLAAIRAGDLITDLLTGAFIVTWLEETIRSGLHGLPWIGSFASALGSAAAFVSVSYVILVFGDLAPKSVALSAPENAAMLIAAPLRLLIVVARPFFIVLEKSNALVLRLLGVTPESEDRVTEEEIRRTLANGLTSGVILSFERSMMERILDLDRRSVRSVMTGTPDIEAIRADADSDTLRDVAMNARATRLLVRRQDGTGQMVGSVSRADLLVALAKGGSVHLEKMATPLAYIAENGSALQAFELLKSTADLMLVVVDEFGSVLGLVTLVDVLEAVAGDVATHKEGASVCEPESDLKPDADGSYSLPGGYPVDDLVEASLLLKPQEQNYKSIAGLVLATLRRIPEQGEMVNLTGCRIEIVSVEQGTIVALRLFLNKGEHHAINTGERQ